MSGHTLYYARFVDLYPFYEVIVCGLNLTIIELTYVCMFVNVFLLDGLHLGRQTFRDSSTTPRMKRNAFIFFSKYPVYQGFLVVVMVNQQLLSWGRAFFRLFLVIRLTFP